MIFNKDLFTYNRESNTLYAALPDLFPEFHEKGVRSSFSEKKFIVKNYRTNGFREFKFVKEYKAQLIEDIENTPLILDVLVFKSEDDIMCEIIDLQPTINCL